MSISLRADTIALLGSLAEPAFIVALDKRILGMNAAAEVLTGTKAKAVAGHSCAQVVRCEVCSEHCPLNTAVERDEAVTSFNVQLQGADGEQPVSLHTAPLRNAAGEVFAVLECARPIGHLVALFQALQEKTTQAELERGKAQAVLECIGDGVLTFGTQRVVTSANRSAAQLLGRPEEEIIGRGCEEALGCPTEYTTDCPLTRVLSGGRKVTNFETEVRDGAGRYVPVSLSISALRDERGQIVGAVAAFRDLRKLAAPTTSAPLVSGNPAMRRAMEIVELVKDSDATVLLQGESGTGKGLLAQTIHRSGRRSNGPFVKVSCGASPESLVESELFGHVKGAFTGAIRDTVGRIELADRGTLFLDEVGELAPSSQVKLLRFLQEREFEPVGSTKTVRVDVRVIAATHQDLTAMMARGRFRSDLFYRLNVVAIELPPLRQRPDDIPALVDQILARLAAKGHEPKSVTPRVMDTFLRHPWPGNIRELENALEHAVVCSKGSVIDCGALPLAVLDPPARRTNLRATPADDGALSMLARHGGNISAAARALGIHRTTLWRRLRKLAPGQNTLPQ